MSERRCEWIIIRQAVLSRIHLYRELSRGVLVITQARWGVSGGGGRARVKLGLVTKADEWKIDPLEPEFVSSRVWRAEERRGQTGLGRARRELGKVTTCRVWSQASPSDSFKFYSQRSRVRWWQKQDNESGPASCGHLPVLTSQDINIINRHGAIRKSRLVHFDVFHRNVERRGDGGSR